MTKFGISPAHSLVFIEKQLDNISKNTSKIYARRNSYDDRLFTIVDTKENGVNYLGELCEDDLKSITPIKFSKWLMSLDDKEK